MRGEGLIPRVFLKGACGVSLMTIFGRCKCEVAKVVSFMCMCEGCKGEDNSTR